ncbi:serine/threonine protein kinase [Actinomadura sp. NBRC 104412]|uniref:protein kinase family protein n=1 Tax=Actinomadura sp. NBRC 104412 TaxID=3032203 RepID=UPI0024A4C3CC|nr:AMP-binding protein [Actinomadura sp. NBRC 104412]GLZ09018.1 serine/threonine protein kinase [Actinomadura sp. NBRC 104412]
MSTSVIEPGTRLAGRYRLEERISDAGGSALWKAIDEILARAVAVRTFDPDFPRVHEVVTSARAASRLTDPRLTQVFDADDSGENAYVVSEWVVGETLEQMLGKGPLEPGRATTLLYEAAEAIAAAHEGGLAHLCLSPRDLVWTNGGTVKLLGVATDAVLGDRYAEDPAQQDVRSLGGLLYAALTAHWPLDPDRSSLPAAPSNDAEGVPLPPRQVRAGVPLAVDSIVCRCLGIEVPGQEPLTDPAALAKALRGVPRTPLPLFAGLNTHPAPPQRPASGQAQRPSSSSRQHEQPPPTRPRQVNRHTRRPPTAGSPQRTVPDPPGGRRPARHSQGRHSGAGGRTTQAGSLGSGRPLSGGTGGLPGGNRALLGIAAAALTVIVGLGAWAISRGDGPDGGAPPSAKDTARQSQPSTPQVTKLNVEDVSPAEESMNGRHDESIGERLGLVTDGDTRREWETQTYADVNFGNLAKGLGVLLDMGRPVQVSSVKVNVPEGGGTLQVKIGDGQSPGSLTSAGREVTTPGETTITTTGRSSGRYVLVWFTKLPPSRKGKISEITVLGSPRA